MYFKKGFTIIEVLISVAVLGILAAYSLPGVIRLVQKSTVVTVGADLSGAITLARKEAVDRSVNVAVCPTLDGERCADASAWSRGWMVYLDDSVKPRSVDGKQGNVLRRWVNTETNLEIAALKGESLVQAIRFNESGLLVKETSMDFAMRTFSIQVAGCHGGYVQTIIVEYSGQMSLREATCGSVL